MVDYGGGYLLDFLCFSVVTRPKYSKFSTEEYVKFDALTQKVYEYLQEMCIETDDIFYGETLNTIKLKSLNIDLMIDFYKNGRWYFFFIDTTGINGYTCRNIRNVVYHCSDVQSLLGYFRDL